VRAGFYVSYNNSMLEPNMTAAVRNMSAAHPGAPLYVIGHSMGAALATICAMDIKFKAGLSDVRLFTFGSPRVGNDVFASFVDNQTTVRLCPAPPPPCHALRCFVCLCPPFLLPDVQVVCRHFPEAPQ
jgi:hypothetical protein